MSIDSWDEIRTAFHVARLGTVSAASDVLGVHHATVIRHIDALESRLGVKLFQRHSRGYAPTEAGDDLLRVACVTDDQLSQLVSRIKGRSSVVSGEIVITTLQGVAEVFVPVLARVQQEYPDLHVTILSDDRLARLEYGEAHIAIRAGKQPHEANNVVQHLCCSSPWLCASKGYVERYGAPESPARFSEHRFVSGLVGHIRPPHMKWLQKHVPDENIVFRGSDFRAQQAAVRAGTGIGFITSLDGKVPEDVTLVLENLAEWRADIWLVTHVDLHRTPKVQTISNILKKEAQSWQKR